VLNGGIVEANSISTHDFPRKMSRDTSSCGLSPFVNLKLSLKMKLWDILSHAERYFGRVFSVDYMF
jgi:hypothetical protein